MKKALAARINPYDLAAISRLAVAESRDKPRSTQCSPYDLTQRIRSKRMRTAASSADSFIEEVQDEDPSQT